MAQKEGYTVRRTDMNASSYSESGRRPATEPELCGDTRRRTATDRGVKVEGLCKKIKGTVILDNVNLDMEPGRIYGLKGRNGCGKTMIMRSLCGLLIPDSGTITIDGKVLHRDIKFPESVGVLIENPSFLPQYTGFRNLSMLAKLTGGISASDIRTAMERTGLDPDDSRTYRKYSLGMKQKLGIANAVMGEPDLIILDEPINALDEQTVEKIREELMKLRDKEKIIVIACHDREELEFLCDTIYEIKDGTVAGCEVIGE